MTATIEDLRAEHAAAGVGPLLFDLLSRVVRATAPIYPAREYSGSGVWDADSLSDALQDWIVVRLVGRGDLAAFMLTTSSIPSLRRGLTTSFSQFIINRRRRTAASNLFKRTSTQLAKGQHFVTLEGERARSSHAHWTLVGSGASRPSEHDTRTLVAAAWELSDDELGVVRYGPYSLKSSPILREAALDRFLEELLSKADGGLTLPRIFEVMRLRFNLIEPAPVHLDEAMGAAGPSAPARVESAEIARTVLALAGERGVAVLRALERSDGDVDIAAADLNVPSEQVRHHLQAAMATIAEYADDPDEAAAAYRSIIESLF